jgi:site-specific recombinase XerD
MGYLYRPKLKDWRIRPVAEQRSAVWWAKWYVNGRAMRESTLTEDKEAAKRFLKGKEGAAATGQPVMPRVDRIRYEEIAADLRQHYETTGRRNLKEADGRLAPLKAYFTGRRVATIGPADVTAYAAKRQAEDVANGTINRELAILLRMLRLAYEHGKLARLPVIRKLKEAAPREGFFERAQYEAVRRRLRPELQAAVTIAYTYGWRMRSEVLTLERRQLDLEAGTLRLDPGATKNDEGRLVYLTPELVRLLGEQLERIRAVERKTSRVIPFLFPYLGGRRRLGQPRRDFRKAWETACTDSGVPGMLRHDFRRTAVRNMVNDGTPEKVAMLITGHKTRAVFDRYHIVAPEDLKAATARMAARNGRPESERVAKSEKAR